jgi:hypothetical protein
MAIPFDLDIPVFLWAMAASFPGTRPALRN